MEEISLRCNDGGVVRVPSSVRTRWDLFDNRLEGTLHNETDEVSLDVPFSEAQVRMWHRIDTAMSIQQSKVRFYLYPYYPLECETICRFFDPKTLQFWLMLKMDKPPEDEGERMRIYSNVIRALDENREEGRPHDIAAAVRYTASTHPRDLFVYCPEDDYNLKGKALFQTILAAQRWRRGWDRIRDNRKLEEIYDRWEWMDNEIVGTPTIPYVAMITRVYDACSPWIHNRNSIASFCRVIHDVGLGAVEGDYVEESSLTSLQRAGREFLAPFCVAGKDEFGDIRIVVRRECVRPLVDTLFDRGIAYFVYVMCKKRVEMVHVSPRLNRFYNILEQALRRRG